MIQPTLKQIEQIRFDRTTEQLEYFILFSMSVCGKSAKQINKALNKFLMFDFFNENCTPFEYIRNIDDYNGVMSAIKFSGLGQYNKLHRGFKELAESNINLKTCTISELERIHGIGFKTSRFFLTFNRPNVKYAVLDRHILTWMSEQGIINVPKNTPQTGKSYHHFENEFVKLARRMGKNPTELDLEIWKEKSGALNAT